MRNLILAQGNRWNLTGKGGSTIDGVRADGAQIGAQIFVVVMVSPIGKWRRRQWLDLPCVGLRAWRLRQRNVEPAKPQLPLHTRARRVPRGASARRRRLCLLVEPLPPDGGLDGSGGTARQTAQEARPWPGVSAC